MCIKYHNLEVWWWGLASGFINHWLSLPAFWKILDAERIDKDKDFKLSMASNLYSIITTRFKWHFINQMSRIKSRITKNNEHVFYF